MITEQCQLKLAGIWRGYRRSDRIGRDSYVIIERL